MIRHVLAMVLMVFIFGTALADTNQTPNNILKNRFSSLRNKYIADKKLNNPEKLKMLDEIIAILTADTDLNGSLFTVTNVVYITNLVDEQKQDVHHENRGHRDRKFEAMLPEDFTSLVASINNSPFLDDKFKIIELSADENYFTMDQIIKLMKMWSFDDEKLRVLKIVYPEALDKANSFKLYDLVTFSGSKDTIKKLIEDNK